MGRGEAQKAGWLPGRGPFDSRQHCTLADCVCVCVCVCVRAQLCPILCNPMDSSLPGSSVRGILQARILEWVAISSPGDLPFPGSEPLSLQADSLLLSHQGNPDGILWQWPQRTEPRRQMNAAGDILVTCPCCQGGPRSGVLAGQWWAEAHAGAAPGALACLWVLFCSAVRRGRALYLGVIKSPISSCVPACQRVPKCS